MKTYFKNYYALFDPVSNQIHQLFSKIPNLNSLLSQQWNGWIWSNRFSSFEIIFKYHFKIKLINFEARTSFGCQNSSCSSSNPLLSLFFFSFWTVSICRITCDVLDPIATSRSQDLSDVPRNIWMANCSLYHRASPIERCQQNGGCNSRLGIFNLSSTTWRNNTCTRSQSLRYCTNENGRSTSLNIYSNAKTFSAFHRAFPAWTAPCTWKTIHPILQFFPHFWFIRW